MSKAIFFMLWAVFLTLSYVVDNIKLQIFLSILSICYFITMCSEHIINKLNK